MSTERMKLYRFRPPEVLWVPLLVWQSEIEDGISTEAEVATAVRVLNRGKVGGSPGIHSEDLKGWLQEATCKK